MIRNLAGCTLVLYRGTCLEQNCIRITDAEGRTILHEKDDKWLTPFLSDERDFLQFVVFLAWFHGLKRSKVTECSLPAYRLEERREVR